MSFNSPFFRPRQGGVPFRPRVDFGIYPGQIIVLDGDSVTAGFNNLSGPDPTYSWSVEFQAAVNAAFTGAGKTPPTFVNTAVGGRTSTVTLANVATPIAAHPDHIFLLSSVNDPLNSIAPATSGANIAAYVAAVQAKRPGCRFHIMSNLWGSTEHWPEGSNTDDPSIIAMNLAEQQAIQFNVMCRYYQIRTPIFAVDEPTDNPSNLATGVLIQNAGGEHPTKPAGQTVVSTRMFDRVTLVT